MKVIPVLALAAAFSWNGPVAAQLTTAVAVDQARLALARDIVDVVLPPAQRQQIMASLLQVMVRNMVAGLVDGTPGLKDELAAKPEVKAAFDRFIARQQSLAEADINNALPELVEAYARAYARNFEQDELEQIKEFVATPTGAKFVQRGSALMSDPDVGAWQRRVTEQGAARQRTELAAFANDLKAARSETGE